MSATSVGQIGLDLVVNQKQFNSQMAGINSLATKVGKTLVAAFSVKKIVEFGAECVNLGSNLQEVQNVVDVTFPSMSKKVDAFAKEAAAAFGLSETMAKQYTGTLGSMAKAFGFSEEQAYDMGSTLAGLAGDVASFYNLSQDEAYTKLKSVFTGETESLKDLGVVMTQTALDSFALAKGFGKTTSAMDEAEKVALRYAFVQDKLSAAQGDFARTSNSWANQTKVLSLQFESLKATIGQGLIAAFTPVIKMINTLLQKVQGLATAFKDMMEGIFGAQAVEGDAFSSAAQSAAEASALTEESTGATADNLKKANKYLAGFDVITKMSDTSTASSGAFNLDIPSAEKESAKGEQSVGTLMDKLNDFLKFLKKKFVPVYESTCKKLSKPLKKLKDTFDKTFDDIKELSQPLQDYLSGDFLDGIVSMANTVSTVLAGLLDSFDMVFGDIWDIAIYPLLEKLIEDWLPSFSEFTIMASETAEQFYLAIKSAFDAIWTDAAAPLLESLVSMFMDFMDILNQFWTEWGEPIFTNLQSAISATSTIFSTLWNEVIKPIFDELMVVVDEIWTDHLKPLVENFMSFVGEFVNGALEIYNSFIAPIANWLIGVLAPVFKNVFSVIGGYLATCISGILDFVNGLITSLKGIIQFITGVFTGDWKKAWDGVKNIFKGVFDSLVSVIKVPLNLIIGAINSLISGIVTGVNTAIKAINKLSFKVPDWVPGIGGEKFGFNIKELTAPTIPKLWQGGYVKKNTPQLAMIGDNRHQGEVVAPEDKLKEMAMAAVRAASGNDYSLEILKVLKEILVVLKALDLDIVIDGKKLKDIIVNKINQHTLQTGVCEIII